MTIDHGDGWTSGDAYEAYMGRWSRSVARRFIEWLRPKRSAHWLDVCCGTGALTATIHEHCEPASIIGCDPSSAFVEAARGRLRADHVMFVPGGFEDLPKRPGGFDIVVSGLVLNFVADPEAALASVLERLAPRGRVAAYVWDYADGMAFLRHFWDEAIAMDASATAVDERRRFPLARPKALATLFRESGLRRVETEGLVVPTEFDDFEDYWAPFLAGTGPAPAFVQSLQPENRERLRERLRRRLPVAADGAIRLRARAWAVRGDAS